MAQVKWIAALAAAALSIQAANASAADKAACERVKAEIRALQAKMRAGYSHAQGVRYADKLRKLKDRRYRLCR